MKAIVLASSFTAVAASNMTSEMEVAPGVWRSNDGSYASLSLSALKKFLGDNSNGCDTYASAGDIAHMHAEDAMYSRCRSMGCDQATDSIQWFLNKDGHDTCVVNKMDQIKWTGLDPQSGSRQVDAQDTTNPDGEEVKMTIQLGGQTTSSNSASLTTTSQISEAISLEVSIPEVMKVTNQRSWLLSSTSTQQTSSSLQNSHANSVEVTVPAGGKKCARLQVDTVSYESHFEVPVCVSGYIRCDFDDKCNGHYYWYLHVDQCQNVKGRASSLDNVNAHATITDGTCHSTSTDAHLDETSASGIKQNAEIAV